MTFLLGVILTTLAILFLLTTLALTTSGVLRHPLRAGISLVAMFAFGLALLAD
jgi:hypothetical protein